MIKALWELLLRSVSKPLQLTLMGAAAFLLVQVQATKTIEQIEYRDVFLGSYFLTSLTIASIVLAIQFFRYLDRPWSYVVSCVFLISGAAVGVRARIAWRTIYDDRGFYRQRHWTEVRRSGSDRTMSLEVIAALNTPSQLTIHVETRPAACPGIKIVALHPIVPPDLELEGSQSLEPSDDVSQFTFDAFRRPARITFYLTLSNVSGSASPENCFVGSITSDGKPSGESASHEGKD